MRENRNYKRILLFVVFILVALLFVWKNEGINRRIGIIKQIIKRQYLLSDSSTYSKSISSSSVFWDGEDVLIAHGGGSLNSYTRTNSYEAIISSYNRGFEYIEADVLATTDGILVLKHDWDDNIPLSYNECINKSLFTVMTIEDSISLMNEHPKLHFIYDMRIDESNEQYIIDFLNDNSTKKNIDRIAFIINDKKQSERIGDKYNWIYRVGNAERYVDVLDYLIERKIGCVCVEPDYEVDDKISLFSRSGIKVLVYKENDTTNAVRYFNEGAFGIFTDFITYEDIILFSEWVNNNN